MNLPGAAAEIYVKPGEFRFATTNTRFHTLLGSCVSITLWHPRRRIGGICHFMLPARGTPRIERGLDGRYADDAIELFLREIKKHKTRPADYQVKIFGGGNMFPAYRKDGRIDIGQRNIEAARSLLKRHGFLIAAEDVGGGHRRLIFDMAGGQVWVKQDQKAVLDEVC